MRIAVNTRLLIKDCLDGIGWFTFESTKRITEKHPEHQFFFLFDRQWSDEFIFSSNITPVLITPQARHPILWYWWFEHSVSRFLKKNQINLFLSPDGFLSLSTDVTSIPVIHDINFFHRAFDFPFMVGKYYRHYFPLYAKKAARIATVSEYSKSDISKNYSINPSKIDVVYNGVNKAYFPIEENERNQIKQKYTQGEDYFIFIGSLSPRKNISGLFLAFDEFKKGYPSGYKLVIVGNNLFRSKDVRKIYSRLVYKNDIIFFDWMKPEKLRLLLGSATALTMVSFFEGFGIPVLEAMYCETPVITSNITSMPEVAGNAALLVNPLSVESIKNGMLEIVKDDQLRKKLIINSRIQRQKFSWDITAEKLWECVEKCADRE